MEIVTDREAIDRHPPLRLVSLLPHHLYTSVFVFTYGCNFNCDFCHNWESTFASIGKPMTPQEASLVIGQFIGSSEKPRIGISGGEPTLNRRWLVGLLKELRAKKHGIRIQVDTNASLLTRDVIDELYEAGMTDISPDLKGLELDTFIKITGVDNEELAQRYLQTAWQSIEHIVTEYAGKLYYTVGIPYHPDLISKEEVYHMGKKLAGLDQNIDVNLIVYQPAFRARDLQEVAGASIDEAMGLLNNTGLKRVWCQEGQDIPSATDPDDLMLLGESMAVFHF
jgi:pyruvate formate lyase activating enzyme